MKILKRVGVIVLAAIFLCSMGLNVWMWKTYALSENIWNIHFPDANSRDTYDSIHHVKAAQKLSTGAGVKVGIMDWGFGFEEHEGLYAGGKDFTAYDYHDENFNHTSEHGFWMAQTLKEISPDVEVYALGTYVPDDEKAWVDAMIEGIHWAMEQDLDILTLSHQALSEESRARFDVEVDKAVEQGIVTTFIHYDNPNNILPWGIWNDGGEGYYKREADLNIFQYDYNTLFLNSYEDALGDSDYDENYKENLYLSVSSMSVVTAGFVAMLMEVDDTLTPAEYKELLIEAGHPMEYAGERAEHVVDIGEAVKRLAEKN